VVVTEGIQAGAELLIAPGIAGALLMYRFLAVLFAQPLFAVTLTLPPVGCVVNVATILAVPCPEDITAPVGTVQL
jgi:hypothetical protein